MQLPTIALGIQLLLAPLQLGLALLAAMTFGLLLMPLPLLLQRRLVLNVAVLACARAVCRLLLRALAVLRLLTLRFSLPMGGEFPACLLPIVTLPFQLVLVTLTVIRPGLPVVSLRRVAALRSLRLVLPPPLLAILLVPIAASAILPDRIATAPWRCTCRRRQAQAERQRNAGRMDGTRRHEASPFGKQAFLLLFSIPYYLFNW
jgi:hypothetical protein